MAMGHGRAHPDIGLFRVAMQQGLKARQERHKKRCLLALRYVFEPGVKDGR